MDSQMLQNTFPSSVVTPVKQRLLSSGAWALSGRITLAGIGLLTNALLVHVLSPSQLVAYFLAFTVGLRITTRCP